MVKQGKHAGLFVITNDNKAIILQSNKSYNDNINRNLKYNKHIPFVEKLSIPRGKHDSGEKEYETAMREFIEETGLVFDKLCICSKPFVLEWQDNSKMYKYVIYVAFLVGTLYYLKKKPNSYNIRLKELDYEYEYKVDMIRQKFRTQELVRRIEFMNLTKYVSYMENRQLATYKYSNYYTFFDYIYNVKNLYDNKQLQCFFIVDLMWFLECEKFNLIR
ncbi:unknown [Choristoneura occidentalis granulovirus]|jgi:ADP-ribose pyrophosphatase YjhB (NUDIX family)|uniref:Nudix hydrolase domain-containing protein n=1 Tax=Choristoneura occidentalis granulovirus TaxID=364745 RepID=Q1A4P5_9BBAC|nr:unknown [Choristoneura fumiferana granulovirus]ABC61185.1 unknown [Choristoneura fumiferana granulovirus]